MKIDYRRPWPAVAALLVVACVPAWAGRVARGADPGFELTRIVSQYRGRTSEAIAPAETIPSEPIAGETFLFGQSNLFPEGVKIETFRPNEGWRTLRPVDFSMTPTVVTPPGSTGSFTSIVIRFAADKVALIQNANVRITIQPQPGPGPTGDVVEGVSLRAPGN